MSNYLESYVLNLILRGSNALPSSSVYLGLMTAFTESSDGDVFTEVATGGYSRIPVTFNAFANGGSANNSLLDFPVATLDWGTVTYFGIFDALSSGNLLYWGQTNTPTLIEAGQQFEVGIGNVSVNISGTISTTLANQIGEHTLRNNRYSSPAATYMALFTSFTSDLVYTENADANYVRQSFTSTTPTNTDTTITNAGDVTFPAAANQYTATYGAVFDAVTSGNLLLRAPLNPAQIVPVGKNLRFVSGALNFLAD